jgi:hypothetical protein
MFARRSLTRSLTALALPLALIAVTAGAHKAEARTMHAHTAWTADGALAVSGWNLSSHGRITVEVDDAPTNDLVDSYRTYATGSGQFLIDTDYIGCYQNPESGDYDNLAVYVRDDHSNTIIGPMVVDGCPS